ncbi:MAG TPA: hypothetical protein PKA95_18715 [Thermomicrobiales bacterium]|nr:hypothetical protein [Thermomicrobiales bacterium]
MSVKTVAAKLQIKPGTSLWTSHPERIEIVGPLPDDARVVADLGQATAALVFADAAGAVRAILDAHHEHLAGPGLLWVAYPKGNRADINRDSLWPILAEYGMRPIGQVAVDEVWSALRFRPLKEGEAQFTGGR